MTNPYLQDKIENWVSDFYMSDGLRPFSPAVREVAGEVLVLFLSQACAARDISPEELEEPDAKSGLMGKVAQLALPPEVRSEIPGVCGAFLAHLETEGRLGGGRTLGAFTRALKETFLEAASTKVKPITNPGSKIGNNDPCPCGSGKKYKKCCKQDF